jgi:hypothetical protein
MTIPGKATRLPLLIEPAIRSRTAAWAMVLNDAARRTPGRIRGTRKRLRMDIFYLLTSLQSGLLVDALRMNQFR